MELQESTRESKVLQLCIQVSYLIQLVISPNFKIVVRKYTIRSHTAT